MPQFHHEGTLSYSEPDRSGKFYRTNQFLKEAGEAMGLPPESGARVARQILKTLSQSLSSRTGQIFRNALPTGLKQECEMFSTEVPKEDIGVYTVKNGIQEASNLEHIDPELVAKYFWSYFRTWLEADSEENRGLSQLLLRDMPSEMARLFNEMEDQWSHEAL